MSARSLRLLPACALVALAVVGAAGASNSASFTDRLSDKVDVYEGVDIIGLQVSNDDAGILTFHVTVAGHKKKLGYNDGMIDVLLDLDQNPDTRSIYYGTEVGFELQSSGIGFLRLRGATIRGAPRPPSLHGAFSNGTASFTVKAADLGLAPSAGFNVPVRAVADWAPTTAASTTRWCREHHRSIPAPIPARRSFTRCPRWGTTATAPSSTTGLADGRGKTADVIRIRRGARLLKEFRERLQNTNPFVWYTEVWRIRHKVRPGRLHFCVRSFNAARNESKSSCAKLELL